MTFKYIDKIDLGAGNRFRRASSLVQRHPYSWRSTASAFFYRVHSLDFYYFCTLIQPALSLHHTSRFLSDLLIPFSLNIRTQSHIPIMCAIPPPFPASSPFGRNNGDVSSEHGVAFSFFTFLRQLSLKETLPPTLTHASFLQISPLFYRVSTQGLSSLQRSTNLLVQ